MDQSQRLDVWSQICGIHFPKENLKCFQLLPIDSTSEIVNKIITKLNQVHSNTTTPKNLISMCDLPKIDHTNRQNWMLIKSLFRLNLTSCMWMQDASKVDANSDYDLEEHLESYKVKLAYELLINLEEKLKDHKMLVNEVAWHKMISWFNRGNMGLIDKQLNECLSELSKMKDLQICKGVSLHEFVIKDTEASQKIALHRKYCHEEMAMKFDIYENVVKAALEVAFRRTELIKQMEEQQIYTVTIDDEKIALDYGSVRHLSSYLYDSDIKNVIEVFKVK